MQTTLMKSTTPSRAAKVALAAAGLLLASCSAAASQASSPGMLQVYQRGTIKPVQGPGDWFTGSVRIDNLFAPPAPSRAASSLVTFERGARTHWHEHPLGQTLIIRSGVGWTQAEGGPIIEVHPGDVVWCPPRVRHWHGATSTSAMSHIAVMEALDGKTVTWGAPVTDAEYLKGAIASEGKTATYPTSSASDADVAFVSPVLARYLRESVDGNLWQRPQLSPRDRSVVTLSVMIARGQTADLASQIARALDNGLKPREISEILTHLGFYAGLANARGAAPVIKAVFLERGTDASQLPERTSQLLPIDAAAEARRSAAVERDVGTLSPGLARFTGDLLFKDLWLRPDLAPRDRSLVTVTSLIANGQTGQLAFHLNKAMDNGLTAEQAGEVIAQIAFYAGWPHAYASVGVLGDVVKSRGR